MYMSNLHNRLFGVHVAYSVQPYVLFYRLHISMHTIICNHVAFVNGTNAHWVFEYSRSRLYTYLSLSLPSGIVHVFEGHTCKHCEQYALLTSHQGST